MLGRMREPGARIWPRRAGRAAIAVVSAAFLFVAPAAAQTPPDTAELAVMILADAFPGFERVEGLPGLPDGPVDLSAQAELGADELTKEQLRAVQAYGRTWANARNDLAIIVLYKLPRTVEAELFIAGLRQGVRQQFDDVSSFPVPSIPGAVGNTFRPNSESAPAHQVTLRKGTRIAEVLVTSDDGKLGPQDVIALAESQVARLPAGSVEAPSVSEETSLAFELGGALAVAGVILGLAGIATRSARKRREAPKPPPVPGTLASDTDLSDQAPIERVAPPILRGLRRRSEVVILLLGLSGGLAVAAAVVGVGLADRITRVSDGRAVNFETFVSLENLYNGIAIGQVVALLITGVAWLMWQHRAQRILGMLQDGATRFTPGTAVGWWLVPIANLFMPYRTMSELYRGSASPSSRSARSRGPMVLLALWFVTFIATAILGRVVRTMDDSVDELVVRSRLLLATDLCYLFAAAMAIGLVRLIYAGLKSRSSADEPAIAETFADPPLVT
jgi:hypothetical protein